MHDRAKRFIPGDLLDSDRLNKTIDQGNRASNTAHGQGVGGMSFGPFETLTNPLPVRHLVVRMKNDVLPDSYNLAFATNLLESNAVVQVWDDLAAGWADVDGKEIDVTPKDQIPLLQNQIVTVQFRTDIHKWLPVFQDRIAHVRIPPGVTADANGFYAAFIDVWDPNNLVWVQQRSCWVRDSNT